MADQNEAPSLFELLGPPISTDPGSVYDYDVSTGEMLGAGWGRQLDTNAMISGVIRPLNYLNEDLMNIAGATEWVGAETARKEITGAGLELKVPDNGISRYELDTIKYLKKRELEQNQIMARNQTLMGSAAGFAGGLAAGLTDPLNIASAFIPIVPQARYAAWVAEASGAIGRAGVRAGVGMAEGVAGAALLEPLAYSGAQQSQLEYTAADSFINIVFGGVMGGGLHSAGGVGFDFFNAGQIAAAKEVGNWLPYLSQREAAANAPDDVKMGALHNSVRALEDDLPVRADEEFEAWHGSPREFDKFELTNVGVENGANFGFGVYLTLARKIADRYAEGETPGSVYQVSVKAKIEDFIDWEKPLAEQSPAVQRALERVLGESASSAEVVQLPSGRWALKNSAGEIIGRQDGFPERGLAEYQRQVLDEARPKSAEKIFIDNKTGLPRVDNAEMSKKLRDAGIRGVIYKHRALEGEGGGLQNLVVFDPSDIVVRTRNGEPVAKPKSPKKDAFAVEDMETSALADRAAAAPEFSIDDVNASYELAAAHIASMRERGLVTAEMEDMIRAGDEMAAKREAEASVYEAALVCDLEA